jgi:hypothetical protein
MAAAGQAVANSGERIRGDRFSLTLMTSPDRRLALAAEARLSHWLMGCCFGLADRFQDDRIPPERLLESHPTVDVHELARQGLLALPESQSVQYGAYQLVSQAPGKIRLDGQEIRVSWHRSLPLRVFVCPNCGRERYKLSCVGGEWGCRGCHQLDYQCRHRCRSIKGYWLVKQLRRRIGASPELGSPLPLKPLYARKHWAICLQIRELEKRLRLHADEDVSGVLEQRYERRRSR